MSKKFTDSNAPVTRGHIDEVVSKIDKILWTVTGVLGLGFVAIMLTALAPIIDAWRFKAASYEVLIEKVSEQSTKIDMLYQLQTTGAQKYQVMCK